MKKQEHISRSPEQTIEIAREFGQGLKGGETVLFFGDLGSGKTTFIRGLAHGAGVFDPNNVSSPSYTLMNIYEGELRVIHADLYRLNSLEEIEDLALLEEMDEKTVLVIEWSERLARQLLPESLIIRLDYLDENTRKIEIET